MATLWPAKTPLISALSAARWKFFLISNFDKQYKMQLLAKFTKILYVGFRATSNFRKPWGRMQNKLTLTGTPARLLVLRSSHGFSKKRETARSLVSYSSSSCHATWFSQFSLAVSEINLDKLLSSMQIFIIGLGKNIGSSIIPCKSFNFPTQSALELPQVDLFLMMP